jgi:hypothetical protein
MSDNKLSQSQLDIILAEAFSECYIIKEKLGEEILIKLMNMFGGKSIEIPTTEQFSELCKLYYGQEGFQTSYLMHSNKELIKYIKRNHTLRSPSQIKESLKTLQHKTKVDLNPFVDIFWDNV